MQILMMLELWNRSMNEQIEHVRLCRLWILRNSWSDTFLFSVVPRIVMVQCCLLACATFGRLRIIPVRLNGCCRMMASLVLSVWVAWLWIVGFSGCLVRFVKVWCICLMIYERLTPLVIVIMA